MITVQLIHINSAYKLIIYNIYMYKYNLTIKKY